MNIKHSRDFSNAKLKSRNPPRGIKNLLLPSYQSISVYYLYNNVELTMTIWHSHC